MALSRVAALIALCGIDDNEREALLYRFAKTRNTSELFADWFRRQPDFDGASEQQIDELHYLIFRCPRP